MKRTRLRRTAMRARRKPHRDPVTPELAAEVKARDRHGCVVAWLTLGGTKPFPEPCLGRLELDHVLSTGFGMRGPSVRWNLVTLCRRHHQWKTEHARVARAILLEYLRRFYPNQVQGPSTLR